MNNCTFVGRLGRDVEVKALATGTTVAEFAVASDTGFGDRKATIWIRAKLWGKRAEGGLIQYLIKGKQVVVSGSLSESKWTAKDGTQKSTLELDVADISLIGDANQQQPVQQDNGFVQQAPQQQQPMQQQAVQPAQQQGTQNAQPDFSEDIPFN